MKLEFLEDLSAGGKYKDVVSENLIRLYDFNYKEVLQLQKLIQQLLDTTILEIEFDKQHFIEAINCQLKLVIHTDNSGIKKVSDNLFICKMNEESYEHMILLMEPFTEDEACGYQWLDEWCNESDIDFLFSHGGVW